MIMFDNKYNGKVVLVTGHTGFKGSWLCLWLSILGAKVIGVSLNIPTQPSNFEASRLSERIEDYRADIRDVEAVKKIMEKCQPDFVFHLAAQSLVRKSYENPLETLTVNALGSANMLEALRSLDKPVTAVMITSDKAYDNMEWAWGYRETDRLGGQDPYSASKGMAELAIRAYVKSFFNGPDSNVHVGVTRAGNVIGGGDWAMDRVVPDIMRAWSCGEIVDIRSPWSTRPWQHVLEPLSGYLIFGAKLSQRASLHGEAFNFGPSSLQNYSVQELITEMAKHWKNVRWNDVSGNSDHLHEAGLLKLNCDKALTDLNWRPVLQFKETVEMTANWYKQFYQKDNQNISMQAFTIKQINEYGLLAASRGMPWAI